MSFRHWLIIIALGTIWGFSFPFNTILLRELGPLWVSAGRVGVGAIASWVILFALKKPVPKDKKLYVELALLGTLTYAVPFALFPLAQLYLSAGVAAIINAMTPITTVIVSHFWIGGEKAGFVKVLGVLAGFTGVAILAIPAFGEGGTSQIWAIGAGLFATFCYAISLNYTRSLKHIDPTVIATIALSGATISASVAAFVFEGAPIITKAETWFSLIGIGVVATALAFQIMYRMLPLIGPTNFSVTTFIAPVSAIVLGALWLNETLLMVHVYGMVAIFIGLLLIDGRFFKRSKPLSKNQI